jgi:hypothetical protein
MNSKKEFLDYVWSFYGTDDPIYPIKNLKYSDLDKAWQIYEARLIEANKQGGTITDRFGVNRPYSWGYGDSIDRERMRDILLDDLNFKMQEDKPETLEGEFIPTFHD